MNLIYLHVVYLQFRQFCRRKKPSEICPSCLHSKKTLACYPTGKTDKNAFSEEKCDAKYCKISVYSKNVRGMENPKKCENAKNALAFLFPFRCRAKKNATYQSQKCNAKLQKTKICKMCRLHIFPTMLTCSNCDCRPRCVPGVPLAQTLLTDLAGVPSGASLNEMLYKHEPLLEHNPRPCRATFISAVSAFHRNPDE